MYLVAPRAGAWIEATSLVRSAQNCRSLPVRERGLKLIKALGPAQKAAVAPRAGAWIEANIMSPRLPMRMVAPRAGAWIEAAPSTFVSDSYSVAPRAGAWIEAGALDAHCMLLRSLPVRERGLKHSSTLSDSKGVESLPVRERGLKPYAADEIDKAAKSLPVRERGLKPACWSGTPVYKRSLPVRERGLKLMPRRPAATCTRRSPCGSVD